MGEICPRSDPNITHMRYYLVPLKLKHRWFIQQCTIRYGIWDSFDFPMLNPHRQLCKYGPHLRQISQLFLYRYIKQVPGDFDVFQYFTPKESCIIFLQFDNPQSCCPDCVRLCKIQGPACRDFVKYFFLFLSNKTSNFL